MEVDRTGRLEKAVHFEQPDGHKDEIGLHPLAMRLARGLDNGIGGWVAIRKFPVFVDIDIVQRPSVLERCAGGLTAYRRFVGAIRVERRIEIDQVHAGIVHASHDVEIVAGPDRAAGEVSGHRLERDAWQEI